MAEREKALKDGENEHERALRIENAAQEREIAEILSGSSDTLDPDDPDELDTDEMHYLSLKFLNHYSSEGVAERGWCEEFPEHGMPCRKCGRKGHTVIHCTNPVRERCVYCGQYNHRHYECPDTIPLEYKHPYISCCYCRQPVSLCS